MAQPPFPQYQLPLGPQKQKRGPLILLGVLVLVLAVVAVIGAVVIVRRDDDKKSEPPAVRTKPANPEAVEFRRVLKAEAGACPSPKPTGVFCGSDQRYTLGRVELDGSHVTQVKAAKSEQGTPYWYVALTLDDVGTRLFGELTADLATKPVGSNLLAIVVRNEVVTTPSVSSAITAGQVEIVGNYTKDQVDALAARITG